MDTSRLLTSHNNNIPTHQQPVGVGQHCQLRLGGHLTLTSIIQQPHTVPTHQQPVGVGQHCQLRLGGHLTLTSIIQQPHYIPTHQQPVGVGQHCQLRLGGHLTLTNITQHTNTSTSGRRGATRSGDSPLATRYPYIVNLAIILRFFDGFGFP